MAIRLHCDVSLSKESKSPSTELQIAGELNETQRAKIDLILANVSTQAPIQSELPIFLDSNACNECAQKLYFPVLLTRTNHWIETRKSLTFHELLSHKKRIDEDFNEWDNVFLRCKKLKKLDLSDAFLSSEDEFFSMIKSAKKCCPNLVIEPEKKISHVICNNWFKFSLSEGLIEQLKILELLTVSKLVTYQKLLKLDCNDWDSVFRHCKGLKMLNFSNAFESLEIKNEMISILKSVGKHCPTIKILDLSFCSVMDDELMSCLAEALPNLTHLNLRFSRCSLNGLKSIAKGCNHLISLKLSNVPISDKQVLLLAEHFPNLCELDLTDSCNYFSSGPITDASVILFAKKHPFLTHYNGLKN